MNELIKDNIIEVNKEVDNLLSTSPLLIRKYMKHLSKAKGKGIRAQSVLVGAIDENGAIHKDAIQFAVAIELLHLATLVHDDVMDDAKLRRGILTLNEKYGRKSAVICGDYVLALALNCMGKVEEPEKYVGFSLFHYMQEIALGELNQHINNGNLNLTVPEYLEIIRGKTAALFEASFFAGAITHDVREDALDTYRTFGHNVGMIFQLMDDCLDYESTVDEALKPVESDFDQGVITLPLIHALDEEPELRNRKLDRTTVLDRVKKYHGVLFTKKSADRYYREACIALDSLKLSEVKHNQMMYILDKAIQK